MQPKSVDRGKKLGFGLLVLKVTKVKRQCRVIQSFRSQICNKITLQFFNLHFSLLPFCKQIFTFALLQKIFMKASHADIMLCECMMKPFTCTLHPFLSSFEYFCSVSFCEDCAFFLQKGKTWDQNSFRGWFQHSSHI